MEVFESNNKIYNALFKDSDRACDLAETLLYEKKPYKIFYYISRWR